MQTVKYLRISKDKKSIILLPSKDGIDVIKKSLDNAKIAYTETIEKIDKVNLMAIKIEFGSECRYLEYKYGAAGVSIYFYTVEEKKTYIFFPFEC